MRILLVILISSSLFSCIQISNFDAGYLVPASSEPVKINFEMVNGLIVIEARINGEKGRFLFDNGFSLSGVNSEFAEKAGILFSDSSNIIDANNKRSKVSQTQVDKVEINGQVFKETGFYRISTKAFSPCDSLDGIIGASIINKANWQVDFDALTMLISSEAINSEGVHINVDFSSNNSAFVNIETQGLITKAKIDFGKSAEVELRKELFLNHFLGESAEERVGSLSLSANGLAKQKRNLYLTNDYPIKLDRQSLLDKNNIKLVQNLKYHAYLGLDFFKDYLVTLNSTEKTYIVKRKASTKLANSKTLGTREFYGVSIYLVDNQWRVIAIDPNNEVSGNVPLLSPVELIDGHPISRFINQCEFTEYLEQKSKKRSKLSVLLVGERMPIELKWQRATKITIQ